MTTARNHLGKADTETVAAIERGVPTLVEARSLLDRLQPMIRGKRPDLDGWINDANASLTASFSKWRQQGQGGGCDRN